MIKFYRWLGAIVIIPVWIVGKIIIDEMNGYGKFSKMPDLFVSFVIYGGWAALCAVIFFTLKPNSEKKEKPELKMEMKRQGERRKSKERRKI